MLHKLIQSTGMDWRISAYRRYWFYLTTCRNYNELIRFDQTKKSIQRIILRDGHTILFQDSDQAIQILLEIWFKRIYTRYYRGNAPQVVADIGANIGLFSLLAHKLWPKSIIHAYEPEAQNYAFLKSNLVFPNSGGHGHVHSYSTALSNTLGELPLYVQKKSGWHSLFPGHEGNIIVTVQATDLPSLLTGVGGRIDFLKMDCEGCEWTSILHHKELLRGSVGYIAMEYHEINQHTLYELIEPLRDVGFICHATHPDAWKTGMLYAENHAYCTG